MELIIMNDSLYQLIPVTTKMLEGIELISEVDCFDLCDILRLKLTGYVDELNLHIMNDGTRSEELITLPNMLNNEWNFLSWSIDTTGIWSIYVDNILQSTTAQHNIPNFNSGTHQIGYYNNDTSGLIGNVDDFRIYDRVLSAAEVEKLYLEGSDRGLIAHYKFDTINEISGYIFKDETSNNYHLTNGGSNNPSLQTGDGVFGNSANFISGRQTFGSS